MKDLKFYFIFLSLLCLAPAAFADPMTYTFSGTGVSGTINFTSTPDSAMSGVMDISGINGDVTYGSSAFLFTGTPSGSHDPNNFSTIYADSGNYGYIYDNLVYTSGPAFDYGGVVAQMSDGEYVNLYSIGSQVYYLNEVLEISGSNGIPVTATAVTPEPSSLLLLGTGGLAFLGAVHRKFFRKA